MTRGAVAGLLMLTVFGVSTLIAQQPRDNVRPAESGRSRIVGSVRDALDGRPLRRARVSLSGSELTTARVVITADDGTFAFEDVPAGDYTVRGSKDGHVTMSYGAPRPGRPGRTVTVKSGASTRVDVRLPPGAVITGTVLNPDGEPAVGLIVTAFTSRYDTTRGERRLFAAPDALATTDDRGAYRIFGLAEGAYIVGVMPRPGDRAELQMLSQAEIRTALAEVRQGLVASRPGMPPPPPREDGEAALPRRSVSLTPIFFPGTPMQERAMPVAVRAGEVRHGVNIDVELVPTSTVEGSVSGGAGMRVQVLMTNELPGVGQRVLSTTPPDDGRFSFRAIPPGTYSIVARAFPSGARTDATPNQTNLWAQASVLVAGEDVTGLSLTLRPALTISGRTVLEGADARLPEGIPIRIPLSAFSVGSNTPNELPSAVLNGSSFAIQGVIPGTYRFPSPPRGIRAPIGRWWLKSLMANGKELLDAELELRESTEDAVLTLSERASQLSGVVRRADGTAVADGFVVVFAADQRYWFHQSRRVAGVRPSKSGEYVFRNLPAGDYLLVATDEIDLNDWFDPEVLKALTPNALRLSLGENETKAQDVSRVTAIAALR